MVVNFEWKVWFNYFLAFEYYPRTSQIPLGIGEHSIIDWLVGGELFEKLLLLVVEWKEEFDFELSYIVFERAWKAIDCSVLTFLFGWKEAKLSTLKLT